MDGLRSSVMSARATRAFSTRIIRGAGGCPISPGGCASAEWWLHTLGGRGRVVSRHLRVTSLEMTFGR